MRPLVRDLAITAGLAAAVIASLVIVRVTASEPAAAPASSAATEDENHPPVSWPALPPPPITPAPPVGSTGVSAGLAVPQQQPPLATLVLSSGDPVNPRLDRTPRTARPAPAPPTLTAAPTPPPESPDPTVFQDAAATAAGWLSALCWYDYRGSRDDNTRRAAAYGDTQLPLGQDPWTLNDPAWTHITTARLSSACTDIAATVETLPRNGTDETTVNLTATQVLSATGGAYQSTPITLTRILHRDPGGLWRIGRAVTAN